MNKNIAKLYNIAQKKSRLILGLMSGTSLDGLDIALCRVEGAGIATSINVIAFETLKYTTAFHDEIASVFSKQEVNMNMLSAMNAKIGIAHAKLIGDTLKKWKIRPDHIDLVASHGQTVFHAPARLRANSEYPNSTMQIGDGDHIAVGTGIITVSDFRQKHIAAGGEGAPLAIYGDFLLFTHSSENRLMLNIGGISNFTILPSKGSNESIVATDVGPGNTLMNHYMERVFSRPFDRDGDVASSGRVNSKLLASLLDHPFFSLDYPKTTGPELFNLAYLNNAQKRSRTERLSPDDVMATLSAFTVKCIVDAILSFRDKFPELYVYVSGGGYHNRFLMASIRSDLPGSVVENTDVLGIDSDAKEAVLFALLANETVAGTPIEFLFSSGAPAVCFGKISFPD